MAVRYVEVQCRTSSRVDIDRFVTSSTDGVLLIKQVQGESGVLGNGAD